MLSDTDKKDLLAIARERIDSELTGRTPVYPEVGGALQIPCGAFVTLHAVTGGKRQLRGCIGHIDARDPLDKTVKSVAHSSAFQDYRFPPLSPAEWPSIEIEISVLSPMELVGDPSDIEPGNDGLYIKAGARSGLLLPQVARERGWDRKTFLDQTCMKAGAPKDCWCSEATRIYRFSADVFGENSPSA